MIILDSLGLDIFITLHQSITMSASLCEYTPASFSLTLLRPVKYFAEVFLYFEEYKIEYHCK